MKIYRRLASVKTPQDVDTVAEEMKDRFGRIPRRVSRLLDHSKIRAVAISIGIQSIKSVGRDVEVVFEDIEGLTNFKRFYKECLTNPSKNVMILRDVIQGGDLKKLLKILLDYHQKMAIIKEGVS
jgi:transcription-repair coupling factor (superfamily II helicase)